MTDGMRRALMKVGAVAMLCIVALVALQSPSPQPRTRSVMAQPTETPHRAEILPAVFRTTVTEDSREVDRRREEVAREYARREEARQRQAAVERAEETRQADRRVEAQRTAEAERVAEAERAAEEERVAAVQREEEAKRAAERERTAGVQRANEMRRQAEESRSQRPPTWQQASITRGTAPSRIIPMVSERRWEHFRLIPGKVLRIHTNGRPCTVRTDVTMDVYPNHPALAHWVILPGSTLRFPLQRGQGPMNIFARPLNGIYGVIELRYDD